MAAQPAATSATPIGSAASAYAPVFGIAERREPATEVRIVDVIVLVEVAVVGVRAIVDVVVVGPAMFPSVVVVSPVVTGTSVVVGVVSGVVVG